MAASDRQKPGEPAEESGTYIEKGPRGGEVDNPRKVEVEKGERLPPTQEPGHTWEPD